MILSTPFSRQNRSHQTWTNGHGNRKPPPQQPAPQQPKQVVQQQPIKPAVNGTTTSLAPFRSQTLNRLDLNRHRQQQQLAARSSLQRNLSSLGHYPTANTATSTPVTTPASIARPDLSNGHQSYGRSSSSQTPDKSTTSTSHQIYAPASIASPREFAHYKRPVAANGESQHYAATSFREPTATSESGKSGRESALGNFLERFGTLRRRAKWSKSSRSKATTSSGKLTNGNTTLSASQSPATVPPQPPPLPPPLDPEIYATGKKKVAAEEIYAEGLRAIDGNIQKRLLQHELDESIMTEGETRTLIEEDSQKQPDYQELVGVLTNWINDELSHQRIIVKDLQDDLYDGQILGKLIETLHQVKMDIVEVTQNEATQKYKLRRVLDTINRILSLQARWARIRWSVEGIHGKNMVEIIHLLVTLALFYKAPLKLPPNVRVRVLVVQKCQNQLVKRSHEAQLTDSTTSSQNNNGSNTLDNTPDKSRQQPDAFDKLLEFAPDKLAVVKQSLVNFVNRHLNKINMSCFSNRVQEVLDPEQFSDGLLLVFLMASLEDYFVPLGNLFTTTTTTAAAAPSEEPQKLPDLNNNSGASILQTALEPTSYTNTQPIHKLHNVNVAFQLMEEAGIAIRERVRAEDIVNGDLKCVLRVLYALFSRYKHL